MNLVSWNVNGLRSVLKKGFPQWVGQEQPDVLCLQETKAHPDQVPAEAVPLGYQAFWSSAVRKGYSGVVTLVRHPVVEAITGLGIPHFDAEGRVVTVVLEGVTVVNVYFPNGQSNFERQTYKLQFHEALLEHVERLRAAGQRVVVCGDFNIAHRAIDLAEPHLAEGVSGFLPQERAWLDRLASLGWADAFRRFQPGAGHYTWWSYMGGARGRNLGWRIDTHWVAPELASLVTQARIHDDITGSDHCPVSVGLALVGQGPATLSPA